MKYFIQRTIGHFCDTMSQLWEGNDLPTFRRDGNPYCFTDHNAAQRVLWRLQAKYPATMDTPHIPSKPITYTLESIDTTVEYGGQQVSPPTKQYFEARFQERVKP